jgi:2-polyprenyl-3-methyl-5-hydroxy-6-metoxy-1,4-benzoquinol methylase
MYEDLIEQYKQLEPEGKDTWSPIYSDMELFHRMALMEQMCKAFRLINNLNKLTVLDIGCGVGRSTRQIIDLNIMPENLTAIDLRSEAIEMAQKLNPAASYKVINSIDDIKNIGKFDLVIMCTLLSSLTEAQRKEILLSVKNCLKENAYLFLWDGIRANKFAGGDIINISSYFTEKPVYYQTVNIKLFPYINRNNQNINLPVIKFMKLLAALTRFYLKGGNQMSHQAILLKQ